ncbi:MAG: cyclopropane fatty acyl phospholipid synthase [Pseudomonadota bacterium]
MADYAGVVSELLSHCGITVNGSKPWDIHVHDGRFYARVIRHKNLGLGEAYMDGWWDCEQIDEFICRILKANLDKRVRGSLKLLARTLPGLLFNRQSRSLSRQVADRHYDVGNDLFMSFLDPYNQYSCAYFNGTDTLEEAQFNKLGLIADKLAVRPSDHVLDIGFGWGGLAKYLTERFNCTVTGINISQEQISFAKEYCKDLPIRVLHCDYRDIEDSFDRIVSVGMFEHVGRNNYAEFMQVAHRCLSDDGIFLLHTIGSNECQFYSDPWITKYIFPNGMLPGLAQIMKAIEGLFVLEDLHNLGPHYDKTLMAWNRNFQKAWPALQGSYDERFKRMWEYYLLSCAGAFRARSNQLWQLVLTKYGTPQPMCRY